MRQAPPSPYVDISRVAQTVNAQRAIVDTLTALRIAWEMYQAGKPVTTADLMRLHRRLLWLMGCADHA